ncbi:MAG: NAD(P)H-hydrate epimerase, partial [Fretibacterium sp.]|nr:NAD(P)H-hydrate epimerase [Fretibacterium sp.]
MPELLREALSVSAMREADRRAVQEFGIPGIVLMENAALQALEELEGQASVTLLCATGNNGGDGLALARHLLLLGKQVEVYVLGETDKGTPDFQTNLEILKKLAPGCLYTLTPDTLPTFEGSVARSEANVDGLFGIGLARAVSGIHEEAIHILNRLSRFTLSLDVPSGINADSGEVLGAAVRAHRTVTFHRMKLG